MKLSQNRAILIGTFTGILSAISYFSFEFGFPLGTFILFSSPLAFSSSLDTRQQAIRIGLTILLAAFIVAFAIVVFDIFFSFENITKKYILE